MMHGPILALRTEMRTPDLDRLVPTKLRALKGCFCVVDFSYHLKTVHTSFNERKNDLILGTSTFTISLLSSMWDVLATTFVVSDEYTYHAVKYFILCFDLF